MFHQTEYPPLELSWRRNVSNVSELIAEDVLKAFGVPDRDARIRFLVLLTMDGEVKREEQRLRRLLEAHGTGEHLVGELTSEDSEACLDCSLFRGLYWIFSRKLSRGAVDGN